MGDRLDAQITVRMTSRQRGQIEARAAAEHRTPGQWLRAQLQVFFVLDQERERLDRIRRNLTQKGIELDAQEARILAL